MVLLVYAFYDECLLIISTDDDGIWARNDFHRKSKRLTRSEVLHFNLLAIGLYKLISIYAAQ